MEAQRALGGATGAAAATDDLGGLAPAALVDALLHALTLAPILTQMARGGAGRTTRAALGLYSLGLEGPLHVSRWS